MWSIGVSGLRGTLSGNWTCWRAGFKITLDMVVDAVERPVRLDVRGGQYLALRPISGRHALRVVYEVREGIKVHNNVSR